MNPAENSCTISFVAVSITVTRTLFARRGARLLHDLLTCLGVTDRRATSVVDVVDAREVLDELGRTSAE